MSKFAIYFPQFYRTDINDAAWGNGFTDWSLVAAANARDLWPRRAPARGFYDGASMDVHHEQMKEAQRFGMDGFAVYHYWFYGSHQLDSFERTLLHRDEQAPRMPWFLIWATESWSRRWIGDPTKIIDLPSDPSDAEIGQHCEYLCSCFSDQQYFRIDGRPVFIFYNLGHFKDPLRILRMYKNFFSSSGVNPLLGHFVKNPMDVAFSRMVDFNYLFEPRLFFGTKRVARGVGAKRAMELIRSVFGGRFVDRMMVYLDRLQQKGTTYSASDFMAYMTSSERTHYLQSLGGLFQNVVSPGWNNTPRYGDRFTCLEPLPPQDFAKLVLDSPQNELPVLINAWNEWSEGAAVEPCGYYGSGYLDALQSVSGKQGA
jgi:Glycosyltransferase WbsX